MYIYCYLYVGDYVVTELCIEIIIILEAAYNLENTLHTCYILFLQGVSQEAIHICFALTVAGSA